MLSSAAYHRIRRNFYRVHNQFISGNDRRTAYDYFMLVCGPLSAESQVRLPNGAGSAGPAVTPTLAKAAYLVLAVGWYVIRFRHARRSRRFAIASSARGPRETALLLISLSGLGIIPFIYLVSGRPHFANYPCCCLTGSRAAPGLSGSASCSLAASRARNA
jgi:hypothetical protein